MVNTLKNSTIKQRLLLGFGSMVVLFAILSVWQLANTSVQSDTVTKMYNHPLTVTRESYASYTNFVKIEHLTEILLDAKGDFRASLQNDLRDMESSLYSHMDIVDERILGEEGQQLAAETRSMFYQWQPLRDKLIRINGNLDSELHKAEISEYRASTKALESRFLALVDYAAVKADGFYKNADSVAQASKRTTIIVLMIISVLVLFFTHLIIKSITKPLNSMSKRMGEIANSLNMDIRLPVPARCEISATATEFNKMMDNFSSAISQTKRSSTSMIEQCDAVENMTHALRNSVHQQKNDVGSVVNAVDNIDHMISQIADHAQQAAGVVETCQHTANKGMEMIERVVSSQTELGEGSEKTVKIINQLNTDAEQIDEVLDVIGSIAEQTNLLALNAAIEAARAGEHGRGFAVVAEEVRNLAQRTESSTAEIKRTIEHVQAGTANAVAAITANTQLILENVSTTTDSGEMLREILASINDINERNSSMAEATKEQLQASKDIKDRIERISEHSSNTENSSTQVTSSNETLINIGKQLSDVVNRFELDNSRALTPAD